MGEGSYSSIRRERGNVHVAGGDGSRRVGRRLAASRARVAVPTTLPFDVHPAQLALLAREIAAKVPAARFLAQECRFSDQERGVGQVALLGRALGEALRQIGERPDAEGGALPGP